MNKLKALFAGLSLSLLNTQLVLAESTCKVNGKEVPCSEVSGWLFLIPIAMFVMGILAFVFWVWMLIDAIKHQEEDKIMWVLIIILLSLLGAVIYCCSKKRKRKALNPAQ